MRIILCGPGASGKDHLKRQFESKGFKRSISYTTREPRENEVDGIDYKFVTEEKFLELIDHGVFYEWQVYPTTKEDGTEIEPYYGTAKEDFFKATLFIMTPAGLRDLKVSDRAASMVIYLDIPEEIRRERLGRRKNADDPEIRIENDRTDFENFTDYDIRIENADF